MIYQAYTDGKLKVCVYHNSDSKVKKLSRTELRKFNVIMISCELPVLDKCERVALTSPRDSSLESIHRKQEKGWTRAGGTVKEDSRSSLEDLVNSSLVDANLRAGVIHSIDYHRLILDEAHSIKVI